MTRNLELCQKSLNEYLDMKKKIFPRFYFVSNVALLDMLSNSNNPLKILPYLGDCYDSIKMLTMDPPAKEGDMPNTASQMIAKDGEVCYVLAHAYVHTHSVPCPRCCVFYAVHVV